MMRRNLLYIGLCLVMGLTGFAQTGSIRGFVYDDSNGEPIIFTNVYLEGTIYGASTDVNGYYAITKVPEGKYTLEVKYLGYDNISFPIVIQKNKIITK